MKTDHQLERYFKGAANHRRIQILRLLFRKRELSLEAIAEEVEVNLQTIAEHVRRLADAGLIYKKPAGREVRHILSPYGERMVKFFSSFK